MCRRGVSVHVWHVCVCVSVRMQCVCVHAVCVCARMQCVCVRACSVYVHMQCVCVFVCACDVHARACACRVRTCICMRASALPLLGDDGDDCSSASVQLLSREQEEWPDRTKDPGPRHVCCYLLSQTVVEDHLNHIASSWLLPPPLNRCCTRRVAMARHVGVATLSAPPTHSL